MAEEIKILKGRCKRTGKKFAFELHKVGSTYKAFNMVEVTDDEYEHIQSEVRQPVFETNDNLLPCKGCHSRNIGGCSHPKSGKYCRKDSKYDFQCTYCEDLELDYSRMTKSPYGQWAGISNIPGAAKDSFGNPGGSDYDLAQDGAFEGYRIVVLNLNSYYRSNTERYNDMKAALKKKGFEVFLRNSFAEARPLLNDNKWQLWVISDGNVHLSRGDRDEIKRLFDAGHGIYLWGDNAPLFADTNFLCEALFPGVKMRDDYPGDQVLSIQSSPSEPGIVGNHFITTGMVNFYEGVTIANFDLKAGLELLMRASDRKVLAAYYDKDGKRAIVDGGFTRLFFSWNKAGTDRYVVNAAAWLANIERFGYEQ